MKKRKKPGPARVSRGGAAASPGIVEQPAPPDRQRLATGIGIVLALATVLVYARTFGYGFVAYDDDQYVYENPMVKAGLSASRVAWAFTTFSCANWHPLTWISYLLDATLFGIHAGAFHGVNVALHAAATVALFLALCRMTRRPWRSAVVAGVFALHPLHVESVAWVSERKDVLSTLLEMIALLLYARYVDHPTIRRYLLVVLLFALGLMAKPMLVTFPFVLLLLDYWPLRRIAAPPWGRREWRILAEKAPLLLMSAAASALTFAAQRESGTVISLVRLPVAVRLANAAVAYVAYIRQALLPVRLALLYPETPPAAGKTALALLVLVALTGAVLVLARRRPYLFTGWFWCLGMLVPVIGIVQVGEQARADRYMYVPLVGLSVAVVWTIADWVESHPALRRPVLAAAAVVLLVLAAVTWRQTGYWRDSRTLFNHTLAVTERNHIIQNNLGATFSFENDSRGAIREYRRAIEIKPDYAEAHANLGHELLRLNQLDAAQAETLTALRLNPNLPSAYSDLGMLTAARGRYREAIRYLDASLRLAPDNADAHNNLCSVLQRMSRREEAIAQCREALRLRPGYPDAERNLENAIAGEPAASGR